MKTRDEKPGEAVDEIASALAAKGLGAEEIADAMLAYALVASEKQHGAATMARMLYLLSLEFAEGCATRPN